jgi:hypothetical protein
MTEDLFKALHVEATRDPGTATRMVALFGVELERRERDALKMGEQVDPITGELTPAPKFQSLNLYEAAKLRKFLGDNLIANKGALEEEIMAALEKNNQDKAQAKAVLGKVFEYAANPAGATANILKDVQSLTTDKVIDLLVDRTHPSDKTITDGYAVGQKSLNDAIESNVVHPGIWDQMRKVTGVIANDQRSGGHFSVHGKQQGFGPHDPIRSTEYTGDLSDYISGQPPATASGSFGPGAETDDFIDATNPDNLTIMPFSKMNPAQREAYLRWVHDPAIQANATQPVDALRNAVKKAEGG